MQQCRNILLAIIIAVLQFHSLSAQDLMTSILKFEGVSGNPYFTGDQEYRPRALAVSNDGLKMIVLGEPGTLFQYSMTTPFEVNTASFDGTTLNLNLENGIGATYGIAFSSDGLKMFATGTNDVIAEYALGSAYDIGTITTNPVTFSVATETGFPQKIRFSNDGLTMIISAPGENTDGGFVQGRLLQYALTTAFDVSTASHSKTFNVGTITSFVFDSDGSEMNILIGSNVSKYSLTTAFDVSTASLDNTIFTFPSEVGFTADYVFSPDGLKMLVLSNNGKDIFTYDLGTAFDVSTASYASKGGNPFGVSKETSSPQGITFSNDGMKMFISGRNGNSVSQYSLTSAFDITTAKFDDISLTSLDANGIAFSSDGTKMYTVGQFDDVVSQHTLTTPFDLSTATLDAIANNPFPIGTQAPFSQDITFSNDGMKMFILGVSDNEINQYDLSTPFDVTTASFNNVLLNISSQIGNPTGFAFSTDGTKLFVVDPNDKEINQYSLTTAFDITTANYDGIITLDEGISSSLGDIYVSPDATKLFVTVGGNSGLAGSVIQYEVEPLPNPIFTHIGEGFDVSTRAYTGQDEEFSVSSEENSPEGMAFNADGTKMFVIGSGDDAVVEYDLSTAYDVSTAKHAGVSEEFNVGAQDDFPTDLAFSSDGMKLFVVGYSDGSSNDFVIEYNLSVAFDVSTAVHAGNSEEFQVTTTDEAPLGIAFNPDGSQMYVAISGLEARIVSYSLSTAFDVSTATLAHELSIKDRDQAPTGIDFNGDGTQMIVSGNNGSAIYEYDLSTAYNLSTAVFSETISVLQQESLPSGLVFNPSGTKLFVIGTSGDAIVEYRLSTIKDFVENETDVVIDIDANDGLGGATDSSVEYAITGEGDASLFSINAAGEITFNNAPDFENPIDFGGNNSYVFGVKASTATTQSTQTITINVLDATPSMVDQGFSVAENSANGTTFATVQVDYTDSDALTYTILSGNTNNAFSIGSNSGELMVNASDELDFESTPSFELLIQVENAGGALASASITINLTDVDEIAPVITSAASINYSENGTGVAYSASADEQVTFTLGDSKDEELFSLSNNNEISFKTSPDFENPQDADANNAYVIDVIATDLAGNISTLEVTITVTDVDDNVLGVLSSDFNELVLYPNPTTDGYVTINFGEAINGQLEVITLDGRIIKNKEIKGEEVRLDLSEEVQGTYVFKVYSDQGKSALVRLQKQ